MFPNNKKEEKIYGMYMNHPENKHNEWSEENKTTTEALKKGIYQGKRDGEN